MCIRDREHIERPELELPKRPPSSGYQRPPRELQRAVPDHSAEVEAEAEKKPYLKKKRGAKKG